jgi:release factor glutamine methyltransferase
MPDTPAEWTVLTMLEWATSYFEEKGISNSRFSIEWLLAHILDVKRLDLYLLYDRPLSSEELEELRPLVKRRAAHEPLQYITGETDFFNTTIKVGPGVLIPRPETEQLVELALEKLQDQENSEVLDIGTGSGCIAIALKKNRPAWNVTAFDISDDALSVAKKNAKLNETEIHFWKDDIFTPSAESLSKKYDLIVSNPPYILREEKPDLDDEVKNYEPEEALFCDSTEDIYGAIKEFSSNCLKKNGLLLLEIHERYGDDVLGIFTTSQWKAKLVQDYGKKNRFVIAKKN